MAIGRCFFFYFSLVNHVAEEIVGHPQKCMELHWRYVRARQSHTGRCRDTLSPALNRCGLGHSGRLLIGLHSSKSQP